ncbi:MAG: putative hydro-lyase [Planctomycetes bacterium]|nr:putative hydro-lyase [Planctomycetota bacterium]
MDRNVLTTGPQVRAACRSGELTGQTSGLASGYAQANLVVLPQDWAAEFLLFCQRNPKPCPLLDVTEPDDPVPRIAAPHADLRTDLPRYRVWRDGELIDEPTDVRSVWREDLVAFVIGCSFTFEAALVRAGVPVRHIELGTNVPMFRTDIACRPAGRFHGPLVVSMRPLRPADAIRAIEITSRYPAVHGAPVHVGLPEQIGIGDLSRPDYGDAVPVAADELPVFWACGVTPQAALAQARPAFAITHSPGCMFVTDVLDETLGL